MTTEHEGITVLDVHESLQILRKSAVGRLAVSTTDHPEIFPINYVVDRGTVVFRTAAGTKLDAIAGGGTVAFEADGYDGAAGEAWSVIIKGSAMAIEDRYEHLDALDLPLFPWHAAPKPRFVRIEPVEITGRRFRVVGHEAWGGDHAPAVRAPIE